MQTPQIEPVTSMVKDHKAVLALLKTGPVFLAQRSRPAAVLVSIEQWRAIARRLAELEGLVQAKQALARLDTGEAATTSHDDLKRLVQEASHVGD